MLKYIKKYFGVKSMKLNAQKTEELVNANVNIKM